MKMRALFAGLILSASAGHLFAQGGVYSNEIISAFEYMKEKTTRLEATVQEQGNTIEVLRNRINSLETELKRTRDEINQAGGKYVTPSQLQELANQLTEKIREVDAQRAADHKVVVKTIEDLGTKLSSANRPSSTPSSSTPASAASPRTLYASGYEYTVKSGDTISAIKAAYGRQGIKTSIQAIIEANEGLNPKSLQVGQTIFIPDLGN